ncbi:MAG TPA: hypothetical protein VII06_25555 [Chloroflexota bacterium]|jgi:hypothetical protein
MTDPAVQQLLDAFQHLDAFGLSDAQADHHLPDLPPHADAALMHHLALGLRLSKRIQNAGAARVSRAELQAAALELRAAAALMEEWR